MATMRTALLAVVLILGLAGLWRLLRPGEVWGNRWGDPEG